jgi:hypothetical protein
MDVPLLIRHQPLRRWTNANKTRPIIPFTKLLIFYNHGIGRKLLNKIKLLNKMFAIFFSTPNVRLTFAASKSGGAITIRESSSAVSKPMTMVERKLTEWARPLRRKRDEEQLE